MVLQLFRVHLKVIVEGKTIPAQRPTPELSKTLPQEVLLLWVFAKAARLNVFPNTSQWILASERQEQKRRTTRTAAAQKYALISQ